MKIIIKDQLPKGESGFFAHYNHKKTTEIEWEYLNVRKYVGQKEKLWLDHIDNWHAELSTVAIQYTKWWWFLPWSRLISFHTPILKPLFFANAIIELIEQKDIKKLFLIDCPNNVINYIKELKPNIEIVQSKVVWFSTFRRKFLGFISKSFFSQQIRLLIQIIILLIQVNRYKRKYPDLSETKLIIYSHLLNKDMLISNRDHFFGRMFEPNKCWKKAR